MILTILLIIAVIIIYELLGYINEIQDEYIKKRYDDRQEYIKHLEKNLKLSQEIIDLNNKSINK